jgi:hypothetical protein
MSTCGVRLLLPKGCFTAHVSGVKVVDETFCPPLYLPLILSDRKGVFVFLFSYLSRGRHREPQHKAHAHVHREYSAIVFI